MRQSNRSLLLAVLSSHHFVPACFALYLGVRLAVVLFIPIEQQSDQLWYYNRAVAIASGKGYSERGILTAFWPVGWPGFMGLLFSLLGPSPFLAQIANLGFAVATFFLALSLGSTLFGDKLVGRLTVLVLAFYPNQIAYVPSLATEVYYTALLLLAVSILFWNKTLPALMLSGVIFGIATLTKAQTLFLPAVLSLAWRFFSPRRIRFLSDLTRIAAIYGAVGVVILPWTVRNYLVFGEVVLISTNGGGTLLAGNNPSARGDDAEDDPLVKRIPADVEQQVAADRLATSMALEWIHDNPAAFAILVPKKVWRLWAPDGEGEWWYQRGFKDYFKYELIFRIIRVFNQLYYVCIILLAGLSVIYLLRRRRALLPCAWTGHILVAYFTLISILFSGQSRFHFALMPWLVTYAAWTLLNWSKVNALSAKAASHTYNDEAR
jgi:hypothetical protein